MLYPPVWRLPRTVMWSTEGKLNISSTAGVPLIILTSICMLLPDIYTDVTLPALAFPDFRTTEPGTTVCTAFGKLLKTIGVVRIYGPDPETADTVKCPSLY